MEELDRVKTLGAMLQGHPDRLKTPGIEANIGSLGQGISIACGMAAGLRIDGRKCRVYCILGDGELAEGQMVSEGLVAAESLDAEGISLRVVNVSTLKPMDEAAIQACAQGIKGIVTAEEHSLIGGLASLITFACRGSAIPIKCVGIRDEFGQSAQSYKHVQEAYGLTPEHIAACALELAKGKFHRG